VREKAIRTHRLYGGARLTEYSPGEVNGAGQPAVPLVEPITAGAIITSIILGVLGFLTKAIVSWIGGTVMRMVQGISTLFAVIAIKFIFEFASPIMAPLVAGVTKAFYTPPVEWAEFVGTYLEQMGVDMTQWQRLRALGVRIGGAEDMRLIGEAFLEPLLNMVVDIGDVDVEHGGVTPEAGIRGAQRYLGVNMQFQMNAWFLHLLGDTLSFGMFKSMKDLPNAISWSYGLGWLSWLVMGVPFQVQITDPMRRYYNERLRPSQYTRKQVIDLYQAGRIASGEARLLLAREGFSNDKIENLFYLEQEKPTLGQIYTMVERGDWTWADVQQYFMFRGFPAGLAAHLTNTVYFRRAYSEQEKLLTTIDKAYLEGQWSRADLVQAYGAALYRPDEVDIILDRLDLLKELKPEAEPYVRRLTPANIGRLYQTEKYSNSQARSELARINFEVDYIDDFLLLYEPREPKLEAPVELSVSVLGRMYRQKVLAQTEYQQELALRDVQPVDITRLERLNRPPEPLPEPVRPPRELSLSIVGRLYQEGYRDRSWAISHLERLRIRPEDYDEILDVLYAPLPEEVAEARRLPVSVLGNLWRREIIGDAQFREYLIRLGYTPGDSDYYMLFYTEEPKPIPEPPPPTELSLSTVGRLHSGQFITTAEGVERLERIRIRPEDGALLLSTLYVPPEPEEPGSRQLSTAQIGTFYRTGVVDIIEASTMWRDQRWVEEDVQRLLEYYAPPPEVVEPPPAPRLLSPSYIGTLYRKGALTYTQAVERLLLAEYTAEDAELILTYIYPVLELDVVEPKRFSTEQIGRLYSTGIVAGPVAVDMWLDVPWTDEDVAYLLALYQPPPEIPVPPIVPEDLSPPTVGRLFKVMQITLSEALERLSEVPYTLQDSMLLLSLYVPDANILVVVDLYRKEEITRTQAVDALLVYGFSLPEVDLILMWW